MWYMAEFIKGVLCVHGARDKLRSNYTFVYINFALKML